jgi:DNA-binding transcriptional regulator YhcF (GntR family)
VAVTDEAIEKIKAMITTGALRAGDRLPREADLAAQLGLSRSSLREAVRALALVNILDVRRGDGTYVTSLDPHLLLEALSFIVDFHRDDTVLEFLRVRRILEPAATAMAAERITEEQAGGLRVLLDSLGPDPDADDLVANDRSSIAAGLTGRPYRRSGHRHPEASPGGQRQAVHTAAWGRRAARHRQNAGAAAIRPSLAGKLAGQPRHP